MRSDTKHEFPDYCWIRHHNDDEIWWTLYKLYKTGYGAIWAASSEKVSSSMRKMCGFTSSCTCAVSTGYFLAIETFYSIQWFCSRVAKTLISLRGWEGWSWPSLSAYDLGHVIAWRDSFDFSILFNCYTAGVTQAIEITSESVRLHNIRKFTYLVPLGFFIHIFATIILWIFHFYFNPMHYGRQF